MRNLAARQAIMGKTASLPYDAEIEYLESVSGGNCYINLNRYDIFNHTISTKVQINEEVGLHNNIICGARHYAFVYDTSIFIGDVSKHLIGRDSIAETSTGRTYFESSYTLNNGDIVELDVNFVTRNLSVSVNGTQKATSLTTGQTVSQSYYPITLFKLNGTSWDLGSLRMYRFASGDIIDLIPVRVGQVGYMYDKVSGQLFGNSGTGAFVLGPDV